LKDLLEKGAVDRLTSLMQLGLKPYLIRVQKVLQALQEGSIQGFSLGFLRREAQKG